jgi:Zn-dependent protease
MESGIPLFTLRGITVRMHISFPLILIWGALQFGFMRDSGVEGAIFGVIVTLLLFAIVILHEFGHSIVAQGFGVEVKQIVLLPIGGVAQLDRVPDNPVQEFLIAIAGPAVNFVLAVILLLLAAAVGQPITTGDMGNIFNMLGDLTLRSIFIYTFFTNLFLGVFNLIPAFPMDGGRVLRALLAMRLQYMTATRLAVGIGQSIAWLMGLFGFLSGNLFLILIAVFVYLGASQEGRQVQIRHVLAGVKVSQVFSRQVETLAPTDQLRKAIGLTLSSFQADFPVCDGNQLVGLLPYRRLVEVLDQQGADVIVGDVMETDIEPVSPDDEMIDVQQRLASEGVDALPVLEGGQFVGLITGRDVSEIYRLMSTQPDLLTTERAGIEAT